MIWRWRRSLNSGHVRIALHTVVGTEVFVLTIAFAVGRVVFAHEAHQIIQGEAVVAGDEVDAAFRSLAGGQVQIGATA